MKVSLIYIIGFSGSDDSEVTNGMNALALKYGRKGLDNAHIVRSFIHQQTVYYQLIKKKGGFNANAIQRATPLAGKMKEYVKGVGDDAFGLIVNNDNAALAGAGGVGVYFLFHGTPGNADIASAVLKYITLELMQIHPNGVLRKVVFVTCGFANDTIRHGLGTKPTADLLQKFATELHKAAPSKADLPKLAGYIDGVFTDDQGAKFGDKTLTTPMKGLAGRKVAFLLDSSNTYQRTVLDGTRAGWSDPSVATTSGGSNVLHSGATDGM